MFLCETKNQTSLVTDTLKRCNFNNNFCITPRGLLGGLAMDWKDIMNVPILNSDDFSFNLKLTTRLEC